MLPGCNNLKYKLLVAEASEELGHADKLCAAVREARKLMPTQRLVRAFVKQVQPSCTWASKLGQHRLQLVCLQAAKDAAVHALALPGASWVHSALHWLSLHFQQVRLTT